MSLCEFICQPQLLFSFAESADGMRKEVIIEKTFTSSGGSGSRFDNKFPDFSDYFGKEEVVRSLHYALVCGITIAIMYFIMTRDSDCSGWNSSHFKNWT